jgi:hypothetical protein
MSKQTAVEFAFQKLAKQGLLFTDDHNSLVVYNQAKAMEKEQIEEAYDAGLFDGTMDDVKDRIHSHYYNETYGGDK